MASSDPPNVRLILEPSSERCEHALVGGKARNLWLLGRQVQCKVPQWFCITTEAFTQFVEVHVHVKFCVWSVCVVILICFSLSLSLFSSLSHTHTHTHTHIAESSLSGLTYSPSESTVMIYRVVQVANIIRNLSFKACHAQFLAQHDAMLRYIHTVHS